MERLIGELVFVGIVIPRRSVHPVAAVAESCAGMGIHFGCGGEAHQSFVALVGMKENLHVFRILLQSAVNVRNICSGR